LKVAAALPAALQNGFKIGRQHAVPTASGARGLVQIKLPSQELAERLLVRSPLQVVPEYLQSFLEMLPSDTKLPQGKQARRRNSLQEVETAPDCSEQRKPVQVVPEVREILRGHGTNETLPRGARW